jgi:hypothetical protein
MEKIERYAAKMLKTKHIPLTNSQIWPRITLK